jgi:hypothetical protein
LILYSISQFFWSRVALFKMVVFMIFTVNILNFNHISTVHFLWVWRCPWYCCPNFSCLQLLYSVVLSIFHFFFTLIIAFVIVMWLEPWRRACEDTDVLCVRTSIFLQLQLMLYTWFRLQFPFLMPGYKHALQCV